MNVIHATAIWTRNNIKYISELYSDDWDVFNFVICETTFETSVTTKFILNIVWIWETQEEHSHARYAAKITFSTYNTVPVKRIIVY